MLDSIKKMFGMGNTTNMKELMQQGAVIVDVRSKEEYAGGHIKGSLNIPLNVLSSQLAKLDKNKPVITCCASGMRSASAKGLLMEKGFSSVHNGGGWRSLQSKL